MCVLNFICTEMAEVAEGPECSLQGYGGAQRPQVFPLLSLAVPMPRLCASHRRLRAQLGAGPAHHWAGREF